MFFGVGYYTFLIGSVTSMISAELENTESLNYKPKVLEDFYKESGMDDELMNKIRQFLLNNYNELFTKKDEEELLIELPLSLREEVLYHQFGGLVDDIRMLRECDDNDFIWSTVQLAQKMKFDKDDPIYWHGDLAVNFYLLHTGHVKLFA